MHKRILNKIAKDWAKSILLACNGESFWDAIDDELLTNEQADYIIKSIHKLAHNLSDEEPMHTIEEILHNYFDYI